MGKQILLAWRAAGVPRRAYAARVLEEVRPQLLALDPERLSLDVADQDVDFGVVSPREEAGELAACVSLWSGDESLAAEAERRLGAASLRAARYAVREAVPVDYDRRTWPDGQRTPGARLVSAFCRRPGLSDAEFLHRWHGVHTPLSLEIHPLWHYNRNVVEAVCTPGAPAFEGIVQEQVRELEDLTDPLRWYGSEAGMERGLADAQAFIDFDRLECMLMSEYILRSAAGEAARPGREEDAWSETRSRRGASSS